jgi:hypothetical protein
MTTHLVMFSLRWWTRGYGIREVFYCACQKKPIRAAGSGLAPHGTVQILSKVTCEKCLVTVDTLLEAGTIRLTKSGKVVFTRIPKGTSRIGIMSKIYKGIK